jgi:hypothetical protein
MACCVFSSLVLSGKASADRLTVTTDPSRLTPITLPGFQAEL